MNVHAYAVTAEQKGRDSVLHDVVHKLERQWERVGEKTQQPLPIDTGCREQPTTPRQAHPPVESWSGKAAPMPPCHSTPCGCLPTVLALQAVVDGPVPLPQQPTEWVSAATHAPEELFASRDGSSWTKEDVLEVAGSSRASACPSYC